MSITITRTFETAEEAIAFLSGSTAATVAVAATPAAEKKATPAAEKKAAPPVKKAKTGDEVKSALEEVKAKHGAPAAKAIIAACGFEKLAELISDGSKNDQAYELAKAKHAEEVAVKEEDM